MSTPPRSVAEYVDSLPPDRQPEEWSNLWQHSLTPWDRGEFSPALRMTLKQGRAIFGNPVQPSGERKKALVPGCGRGWDVLLLASFGYDAYGLDVSVGAVEACRALEAEAKDELPVEDAHFSKGKAIFVQGNFFEDDWRRNLGVDKFHIIYDYTFFCALNPTVRPKWAQRMSQLLAPSPYGRLICLEWPRDKSIKSGGPPFSSPTAAYIAHLSHPGKEVSYDGSEQDVSSDGFERLSYFQPAVTFKLTTDETGQAEEMVAIWQKKS